ncbi:PDZ domain-containing protein [Geobacter sp. FeAm09]|uniref:PDZ domain-containing protein n=1 Tax=Geobacter sp. FeAm09 TaxID=2597769 RepID=UPI0011ECB5A6|nr:PDZ domain-containing protein [Geobacter sp. FeAm09]QEM67591.1 PDZ domain-containing protein [Geobacter sp. FeAm09]
MKTVLVVLFVAMMALPALGANGEKNFGGVGIDGVAAPDGQITVRQLVTGGPAHVAGIKVGDVITHIDGKPTRGSDFRQMVQKRLRGVAGTPVVLKVRREGVEKPLTFALHRQQLVITAPKEK